MNKKTKLLAILVASAVLLALPPMASAAEVHLEGATQFTGHGPANAPSANSEPKITCETSHVEGEFTSDSTGVFRGDVTGCHINVLGFTIKCRTSGSALDNTIEGEGTFHLITTSDGAAMLGTPVSTTIICGGFAVIETGGSLITTITSPKCGEESLQATGVASATNGVQDHKTYTGKTYYPTATTQGSEKVLETSVSGTATITFANPFTLNCT